ncbi:MAG: glycosyltransferase [Candidatus Acidiferrales bacterium]
MSETRAATETTFFVQDVPESISRTEGASLSGLSICHFTTAHSQLKSRSFHRICLPFARRGASVTYISPAQVTHPGPICLVPIPQRSSRVSRALWNRPLLRELCAAEAQVYHFQDPELLPLALALKLFLKKRVIYDAYEDFPSMARNSRSIPRPFRRLSAQMVALAERLAARFLDAIVTADPFTLRRLARCGTSPKLVVSNFPNLEFFPPPASGPKAFDLVYRGGLSRRAGTHDLLDAMQSLKSRSRSLRLLLIGYFDASSDENDLRDGIQRRGLTASVEIRGRIPHEQMASALGEAKIGICPLHATSKFELNVPVKVFEYWACGLPVIATDLTPIRPYLRTANAGLLFEPGDVAGLARSIEWLADHPRTADAMGRNGRAAVISRFNNRLEIRRFEKLLAQVTTRGKQRDPRKGNDA